MDEMTIEHWQDPGVPGNKGLKLAGNMTIGQAADLKDVLMAALETASELRLDLTGVTEIDLTGLQLLDAAHRSSQARGKRFSIEHGGNRTLLDTIAAAGFQRRSGCASDTSGTCIWVGGEC
jgi:ABC-type transporter Mla MlaB component